MAEQSSMRRDIVSAYLASGAKIVSWVVVSAVVYRVGGAAQFGVLALICATIGLLQYVSMGLGTAIVKLRAEEGAAAGGPAGSAPTVAAIHFDGPHTGA